MNVEKVHSEISKFQNDVNSAIATTAKAAQTQEDVTIYFAQHNELLLIPFENMNTYLNRFFFGHNQPEAQLAFDPKLAERNPRTEGVDKVVEYAQDLSRQSERRVSNRQSNRSRLLEN